MNKAFSKILLTTLLAAGLTATAHASEGTTLTMMINASDSDASKPGYEKIIEQYNETNTMGVTVEATYYTNTD